MNDNFTVDETENKKAKQAEEEAWQMAKCIDTLESYRHYMDSYPQGLHITEAHHRINDIVYEQKERIIRELCEDRNAYSLKYVKACGITIDDLRGKIKDSKGQVRDEVLKSWNKQKKVFPVGSSPERIPEGVTEVYFWGVHGSGKTCVLDAIFSCAVQMGYTDFSWGLCSMEPSFITTHDLLPAVVLPTYLSVDSIQYLPLSLFEFSGRNRVNKHRLSIIDIPGGIFDCFRCELMGNPFETEQHRSTYEQLKLYLNNNDNPKYHFFVLDGATKYPEKQQMAIQMAALYFREHKVFNKTTQKISLLVTKCDELSSDRKKWLECAMHHVEHHYAFFSNTLKRIVSRDGLGLTDGRLRVIPFSIGEVFFQNLCIFNPESAKILVDLLMEYAKESECDTWKHRFHALFHNTQKPQIVNPNNTNN